MSALFNSLFNFLRWIWHIVRGPLQVFTIFLRTVWLLFPAVLFFFAAWMAFWKLSQGRDVLISTLEREGAGGIVLLAILFWAMVNWYSSRMLAYRRNIEDLNFTIGRHMPRLLGYLSFSLVWIGLMRLPKLTDPKFNIHENGWMDILWLAVSIGLYIVLTKVFENYKSKRLLISQNASDSAETLKKKKDREDRRYQIVYTCIAVVIALLIILNTIISHNLLSSLYDKRPWVLLFSIMIIQLCFLFFVVVRLGTTAVRASGDKEPAKRKKRGLFDRLGEKLFNNTDLWQQEKSIFFVYNCVAAFSITVYFIEIVNYDWSVKLGSFSTVVLAFGILTGIFSIITFFSIVARINFHMIILIMILLFGKFFPEPHNATLIDADKKAVYKDRPGLREYFSSWVAERIDSIKAKEDYPVYFTLADGGASRSGYWTAATLGKLEDITGGNFSHHLFCLSGASGGSVGNGTFLALLKLRKDICSRNSNFTDEAHKYLKSDFLSYTLARMLGPDFIRAMFGKLDIADRAAALENALESGEDKTALLYKKFKTPFSAYIPTETNQLPIICINVTRVQDGCPSVISNIKLDNGIFGQRVDILSTLPPDKEMKLSTAVIMGARFPYISPAGRIDSSYYVDGGYFDNSGAGIVQEMILELNRMIKDSIAIDPGRYSYLKHLSFYVIHSKNGFPGSDLHKIQPLINDVAAPVLTLIGAFGTQTSVNDWRLIKYLGDLHRDTKDTGYYPMNLYSEINPNEQADTVIFPMNWAISKHYIDKMKDRLENSNVKTVINVVTRKLGQNLSPCDSTKRRW